MTLTGKIPPITVSHVENVGTLGVKEGGAGRERFILASSNFLTAFTTIRRRVP